MAEVVGFEPTDPFEPHTFKVCVLDRSTTLPHYFKYGPFYKAKLTSLTVKY